MDDQVQARAEKSCNDCHTTTTPLWRAGPDGPRSLCNACGLRYRKRRAILGLDKGGAKKSKKRNRTRKGSEDGVPLNKSVNDFGRHMEPYLLHGRQCNLKEEEEAAILLMALSCGSVCAY